MSFSMLEIYNEQVRDLLSRENPKGGLQVRQNVSTGAFYVQGLKFVPVGSYVEIERRMNQGKSVLLCCTKLLLNLGQKQCHNFQYLFSQKHALDNAYR